MIGSFNHGSMANALPPAIGAQASQPDRQVVTLSGDGGIAMLLGDLLTLRQNRLPVKVIVFNNGALSFVELEMKAAGIVTYGTELIGIAAKTQLRRAQGIHAVRSQDDHVRRRRGTCRTGQGEPAAGRGRVTSGTPAGWPAVRRSARST